MSTSSHLRRLGSLELAELAARAWLKPGWSCPHPRLRHPSQLFFATGRQLALWVALEGVDDSTQLEADLGSHRPQELIWLDLREPEAPALDLSTLAPQVSRRTLDDLLTAIEQEDGLAPWSRSRPAPPQLESTEVLLAWLGADLVAEQYVRMAATGGDQARRTSLKRVFTDLPLRHRNDQRFLGHMLPLAGGAGLGLFRPSSEENRTVLVGGPGQGKTTLGQYLCQLHRAAMLQTFHAPLTGDVQELVEELAEAADEVICQRVPLFITLHRFADALARGEVTTVEEWVARQANLRLQEERITPGLIAAWLGSWPALVVFDGLDEVPPSANRGPLLDTIHRFLDRYHDQNLVVLLSTRPQGYRGELDDWSTLELADLGAEDVHSYGERLYASWVAHDPARREELLRRLDHACADPTTAHLARSPLQVLILAALVEQSGRPPRERWRLFREYFRIILDRERERQFAAVQVLRDHQDLIERLHAELGYRAQLAGELTGGTSDGLRRSDVAEVVRQLLLADHQDPAEIDDLVDRIDRAVFDRLVFLCGEGDDRVRFDVRSLQEFFAAERLFLGPEALVPRHLEAIAGSAHWRQVLLFAVGRLVAERPHLTDRIEPLCDTVDAVEGGLGGVAGVGMRLALWLLTDGAVGGRPRMVESLLRRVVDRAGELDEADAGLLQRAVGEWPREVLVPRLIAAAREGSWMAARLAVELLRVGSAADVERLERAFVEHEGWALLALSREGVELRVYDADRRFASLARRGLEFRYAMEHIWWCTLFPDRDLFNWIDYNSTYTPFARISKITHIDKNTYNQDWNIIASWTAFSEQPSPENLIEVLEQAKQCLAPDNNVLADYASWPIAAIAAMPRELWPLVSARLRAGELGSSADWQEATNRLTNRGPRPEDWLAALDSELPFTAEIATVGVPLTCVLPWPFVLRARQLFTRLDEPTRVSAVQSWNPYLIDSTSTVPNPIAQDLRGLHNSSYHISLFPYWWQNEPWLAHLAETAEWSTTHNLPVVIHQPPEARSALLAASPRHPWLLRWLVDYPDLSPDDLITIPATFDDPRLTWVALLVRLPLLTPEQAPALAQWMSAHQDTSSWALPRIPTTLVQHAPPGATALLRLMLEHGLGDPVALRRHLRDLLSARPTALQSTAVALDHGLPPPLRPQAILAPSDDPLLPVQPHTLTLEHVRVWEPQTLTLHKPAPDRGAWLFVVGPNGSGKTTLLRGLALSLLEAPVADKLLADMQGTLVRSGAEEARLALTLHDGRRAGVRVRGEQVVAHAAPPDLFVVGYGPRRGTLLGVTRQEVRFQPSEAVETLFIEGGNLIHATSWLKDLDHARLADPGGEGSIILDAALAALRQLLPGVSRIEVGQSGVHVHLRHGARLPIEDLSDGYITTAGWVIDLVARWVHHQRTRGRSVSPDMLSRMTGLVLIDEIDLHLHPRWQWAVVDTLRELFPRLSFIVTTHNPVTLLGAAPGEVAVIEVGESGQSRAVLRDIPQGTNAEELLTGPWFGLPSTVDRDTLRLLDEQRELLRRSSDPARLKEVDEELRRRLRRLPHTGVEREAEQLLAREQDRRLEEMTPEERELARQRAADALRRAVRR